jgi:predicted lactoylglutathione lyase
MFPKLFLILPVENLDRATAFYHGLGYALTRPCGRDRSACVAISEQIHAVLQTRDRFATLTAREIVDAERSAEAIFSLVLDGHDRVDELADRALMAGGRPLGGATERPGCYRRGFLDPDGHQFALVAGGVRLGRDGGEMSAPRFAGSGRDLSALDLIAALDLHRKRTGG